MLQSQRDQGTKPLPPLINKLNCCWGTKLNASKIGYPTQEINLEYNYSHIYYQEQLYIHP